jgi:hypothetical protein
MDGKGESAMTLKNSFNIPLDGVETLISPGGGVGGFPALKPIIF